MPQTQLKLFGTETREEFRMGRIKAREEFGGSNWSKKPIYFPEVVSFSDLFVEASADKETGPKAVPWEFVDVFTNGKKGHCEIGPYCSLTGATPRHSLYVKPADRLVEFVKESMLPAEGHPIYFEVIVYEDGLALVTANHNHIIGNRWLALIEASTIPEYVAVERSVPAEKQEPTIALDALKILSQAAIEGNAVVLTCGKLDDRKLYDSVSGILEKMGGKWNRKAGGHVFKHDPTELMDLLLMTGTIKKPEKYGYFPTPKELAKTVVEMADVSYGMTVLEPSAGSANLADIIAELTPKERISCCELQQENVEILEEKGYFVQPGDFMSLDPKDAPRFQRVVMNPPFEKQQDISHVLHAWDFLEPGGRLVSIMASSFTFRGDAKSTAFRAFVDEHGKVVENPDGSFKQSGTNVKTVTVVLDKPAVEVML